MRKKQNIKSEEAAYRILDVLKQGRPVCILRDLAQQSGFRDASDINFRAGLNFLIEKKVVKLRQSGWRSEKRGGNVHPKSAVLLADVYEFEKFEGDLKPESRGHLEPEEPLSRDQDLSLVCVTTPCGETSFISKSAFDREKRGDNFWTRLRSY